MTKLGMEAVIGRLLIDREYRNFFYTDPRRALTGYDLTAQEVAVIEFIGAETLDALADILDRSLSTGSALARSHRPRNEGL